MSKHTIFLVHGMGDWKPKWSESLQKKIRELYDSYPTLHVLPFNDVFEFQEINYNDKFDALREQWKSNADAVLKQLGDVKADDPEVESAIRELAKAAQNSAGDGFLGTHVLDVVLYRFISSVASEVRTSVAKQILGALKNKPKNQPIRWSIIAHSLGTSVTHDTIHALFTDPKMNLPSNVTRPHMLAMIANVSRVLETDADPYTSFVHPSIDPAAGACDFFLNARHEWDLFTIPKRFKPQDDWPDTSTRADNRYRGITINAFAAANVHGFSHYLDNPQVHIELFRLLTFDNIISKDAEKSAITRYEASTPLNEFADLLKSIKAIKISEESTWEEVIAAWKDFIEAIDKGSNI